MVDTCICICAISADDISLLQHMEARSKGLLVQPVEIVSGPAAVLLVQIWAL